MQNLLTVIKALEKIGASLPDVHTVILSDIYQLNSLPNIDYSVFAIVQDQHRKDDNFTYLGFYLYYVDRLLNDKSNQIEIQSHGLEILSEVIDKIEDLGLILSPEFDRVLQPFNQRFSDECAGIYCRLEIMIPQDCMIAYDILVNPKLANLAVYQPGTYHPEDYGADGFRVVDVSGQSYQYYTENEADKTARINNEYHNIEVSKSGVTYDGYQIINSNILSAYTYNKNETDERISQTATYYYNQLEPRVAQNEQDIAELSGNTIALSASTVSNANDIASISAATSSNTVDIIILSGQTSANTGNINILSGLTSANTENLAELSGNTSTNTQNINILSGVSSSHTSQIEELSGLTSANTQNIETLSGITSGLSADIAALSAQTSGLTSAITIQVAELSGLTSANTENITTLSSITSANTTDIQALSAITSGLSNDIATLSAMTDDFVKKDPINVVGTSESPVDFNTLTAETGYYYVNTNNSYAINHPSGVGWLPDGMLEVVQDPDSTRITQVFTANFGSIQAGDWPKRWYRVYCYLAEGYFGWSAWQEIASKEDIKTLSGLTSANTQAIATLSGITSAITNDLYVNKKPLLVTGSYGDLNTIVTTGYYHFEGAVGIMNAPEAGIYEGILNVISDMNNITHPDQPPQRSVLQEFTVFDNLSARKYLRIREYLSSTAAWAWGNWYQIPLQ